MNRTCVKRARTRSCFAARMVVLRPRTMKNTAMPRMKNPRRITETAMLKSSTVAPMVGRVGSAELQNTYLSMMKNKKTRLIPQRCVQYSIDRYLSVLVLMKR
eukprot:Mycagemm_TRINITY_DN9265_c0_g1::TRINITY_DN9265_c0_g1_i1::g.365::m.365 type:complete len:102 gc:universal TRINITY_DN9265_c0_g1_i1:1-306(+)